MEISELQSNAMTVDVEDYFQVSAFEGAVSRKTWESFEPRVEANTDKILALFDSHGVHATFFVLGWVAERYPALIRRIVDGGHELASHGWQHTRVTEQNREEFGADIKRTKSFLEDTGGVSVNGYRAASYSIGEKNFWALDELAEAGYLYSSSIAPLRHDLYGMPDAPRFAFRGAGGRLTEIPVSTVKVFGRAVNCGGGGWFRLFPYHFSRWALERMNRVDRRSAHFYFHPWEIDPTQPRPSGLNAKARFRHYLNLEKMQPRLVRLMTDFRWDRMDVVFKSEIAGEGIQAYAPEALQ